MGLWRLLTSVAGDLDKARQLLSADSRKEGDLTQLKLSQYKLYKNLIGAYLKHDNGLTVLIK